MEKLIAIIEKIVEAFPPLFNWLHAREIRKGEESDRREEQRLIEIIATGEHLLMLVQTMPDSKKIEKIIKNEMKIYKEQLKEVRARLRK